MSLRIIFAGTPAFAVPCLLALIQSGHSPVAVYTQPDRPAGRGQKITASAVKTCALSHGLPVLQPDTLRDPASHQQLAGLQPDLMVVVAYGLILPSAVLKTPRLGCINVHASLLPRWRGAAPIQRAILAGDKQTGITIMQMDEGLDTGSMLLTAPCDITPTDTTDTLHGRLSILGAETLIQTIESFNKLTPVAQDNAFATYAAKIVKPEARIDWQLPAEVIARQIRAFDPWPGAYTGNDQTPLKIWQAKAFPSEAGSHLSPGQIIQARKEGLDITTGRGFLRVEKLQMAGGKILFVTDFLQNEHPAFMPGMQL